MLRRVERPSISTNVVGTYDALNERLALAGASNAKLLAAMKAKLGSVTPTSEWQLAAEEQYAAALPGKLDIAAARATEGRTSDELALGPLSVHTLLSAPPISVLPVRRVRAPLLR